MATLEFKAGFGDENRDATKAIEAGLQADFGRDDLWCTYSPAEATAEHPIGVIIAVHLVTDAAKHKMEQIGAVHFPLHTPFELEREIDTFRQSMVCAINTTESPEKSPRA